MARTILISVKDPNITYLLQRYAEESGFETTRVCEDKDVLDLARTLFPALIILGSGHSNLADVQTVRALRADPLSQRIPIVIYPYLDEFPETLRADIDGSLPKALLYDDFRTTLERAGLASASPNPVVHSSAKRPPVASPSETKKPGASAPPPPTSPIVRGGNGVTENTQSNKILLQVNGLKKHFPIQQGVLASKTVGYVKAVDDVSFYIREGETLGLVGESGCGKSTTGRVILRASDPTAGEVWFNDRKLGRVNIPALDKKQLAQLRQNMQLIFQDPYSSLNPRMTLLEIVGEPLYVNHVAHGKEMKDRVAELLRVVGLRPEYMVRYPHAFSGGQRQRIGIARALALHPQLVICDEPVSALDVSIQAQILNLLKELQGQFGLTYLFISHDLSVVEHISDRVAVMYVGKLVESAATSQLYLNPRHPYTEALLSAVPKPDPRLRTEPIVLPGEVADPANPPSGCYFHPRCPYKIDRCSTDEPALREIAPDHFVSCHRADELKLSGVSTRPSA